MDWFKGFIFGFMVAAWTFWYLFESADKEQQVIKRDIEELRRCHEDEQGDR